MKLEIYTQEGGKGAGQEFVYVEDLRAWLDKTITKIEKWHEAPKSDRLNLMKEEHIDTTIMRYYPDGTEALYALQRKLKTEEASRV